MGPILEMRKPRLRESNSFPEGIVWAGEELGLPGALLSPWSSPSHPRNVAWALSTRARGQVGCESSGTVSWIDLTADSVW